MDNLLAICLIIHKKRLFIHNCVDSSFYKADYVTISLWIYCPKAGGLSPKDWGSVSLGIIKRRLFSKRLLLFDEIQAIEPIGA